MILDVRVLMWIWHGLVVGTIGCQAGLLPNLSAACLDAIIEPLLYMIVSGFLSDWKRLLLKWEQAV